MKWRKYNNVTIEEIEEVEKKLGVKFPEDFLDVIKKYDGGYPEYHTIVVNGMKECLNNLVSFKKEDVYSYILNIIEDTEYFNELDLIPIGEDPGGNLFCYSVENDVWKIVFCDHEKRYRPTFVCNTFTEFIEMLHYNDEDEEEEDYI